MFGALLPQGGDSHGDAHPHTPSPPKSATTINNLTQPSSDPEAPEEDLLSQGCHPSNKPAASEIEAAPPLPSPPLSEDPRDCPSPSTTPVPVTSPTPAPSTTSCCSPLSPDAEPFYPCGVPGGRGKRLRWRDDDHLSDMEDGEATPPRVSYLDALLRPAPAVAAPKVAVASSSAAAPRPPPSVCATRPVHDRLGLREEARSGRRWQRRCGQTRLVHGLLHRRPESNRSASGTRPRPVVVQQTWEPKSPPCDEDGFTEVRNRRRSSRRRRQRRAEAAECQFAQVAPPRIPPELSGRCLNCLSFTHLVAQCRLPTRCLRCHGFRHLARECKWPRSTASSAASGHGEERSLRVRRTASPPVTVLADSNTAGYGKVRHAASGRARVTTNVHRPHERLVTGNPGRDAPECRPAPVAVTGPDRDDSGCRPAMEEKRLQVTLMAAAPGGRSDITAEAMSRAITNLPGIGDNDFIVQCFAPGSFVVLFASQGTQEGALGAEQASLSTSPTTAAAEEGDNHERTATCSEVVSFEDQCPFRDYINASLGDPMLFELMASCPEVRCPGTAPVGDIRPPSTLQTPPQAYKTYRRRARSAAALEKAALPSPTVLNFEHTHILGPEPSEEATESVTEPASHSMEQGGAPNCDAEAVPHNQCSIARRPAAAATPRKRAKTQPNPSLEEAQAATAAFLASVSRALDVPLASMPPRGGPSAPSAMGTPATPGIRRSERLASQPLNSTVRASKKGELLVLHKLGLYPEDDPTLAHRPELASIFRGPLDDNYFAAMRDIFPAARALSDADLRAVAVQLGG